MSNVVVNDLKVDAEKLLSFLAKAKAEVGKVGALSPQVTAAVATILGAVASAVSQTAGAAASEGVNISLDAAAFSSIKAVWSDVVSDAKSLGIEL